jgi:ParB-like chromosome segregation protein Spo0J
MTIQTVPLSSLETDRSNPRKAMNRTSLEGLAASIRTDGVLQNLVVRPVKGKRHH